MMCDSTKDLTNLQCKLVPVFTNFLDVVLQVVEEKLHHVQLLLSPPNRRDRHSQYHNHKHKIVFITIKLVEHIRSC